MPASHITLLFYLVAWTCSCPHVATAVKEGSGGRKEVVEGSKWRKEGSGGRKEVEEGRKWRNSQTNTTPILNRQIKKGPLQCQNDPKKTKNKKPKNHTQFFRAREHDQLLPDKHQL